jgi:hypothetical protein
VQRRIVDEIRHRDHAGVCSRGVLIHANIFLQGRDVEDLSKKCAKRDVISFVEIVT